MSRVIVDDEKRWRIKSTGLVGEHVGALHISIICYAETLVLHQTALVQIFEDLDGF